MTMVRVGDCYYYCEAVVFAVADCGFVADAEVSF